MTMPSSSPPVSRLPQNALAFFALGCLIGGAAGFCGGVLSVKQARSFFTDAMRNEKSADVANPQRVERPAFQFQYPGNWKLDTANADYDPDHMFSLDSTGQSFMMFVVAAGEVEPKVALEQQVTAHTSKVMREAKQTPFQRWGHYAGQGALLTGKSLGITPATLRIFAFRAGEQTYTIVESTFDEDRDKVAPGFALIEQTFKVKDGP